MTKSEFQVPEHHTTPYPVTNISTKGEQLQTSTLGLLHTITRQDMNPAQHTMKVKCVASIYTAYYKTVEIIVGRRMRKRQSKRRRKEVSLSRKDTGEQEMIVLYQANHLTVQEDQHTARGGGRGWVGLTKIILMLVLLL